MKASTRTWNRRRCALLECHWMFNIEVRVSTVSKCKFNISQSGFAHSKKLARARGVVSFGVICAWLLLNPNLHVSKFQILIQIWSFRRSCRCIILHHPVVMTLKLRGDPWLCRTFWKVMEVILSWSHHGPPSMTTGYRLKPQLKPAEPRRPYVWTMTATAAPLSWATRGIAFTSPVSLALAMAEWSSRLRIRSSAPRRGWKWPSKWPSSDKAGAKLHICGIYIYIYGIYIYPVNSYRLLHFANWKITIFFFGFININQLFLWAISTANYGTDDPRPFSATRLHGYTVTGLWSPSRQVLGIPNSHGLSHCVLKRKRYPHVFFKIFWNISIWTCSNQVPTGLLLKAGANPHPPTGTAKLHQASSSSILVGWSRWLRKLKYMQVNTSKHK